MIFLTNSSSSFYRDQAAQIQQLEIQLLNPKYPEDREVFAVLDLQNYDSESMYDYPFLFQLSSWQGTSQLNYSGYYKFH
jgi:hypothetical protein